MSDKPKLTVSLLTWNGARYLPMLLNSLHDQTFKDWELLVLDNASYDNSVAVVEEYFPQATIIKQKQNLGFAKGHNLLIKWSKSDYVLVLNQDVILDPGYLQVLVKFLDQHSEVASVSGKILYWDFEEHKKTNIIDSLGLKINRQREVKDIGQGEEDREVPQQAVFGLSAVATLYRRQALESIKWVRGHNESEYFDEDFFAYKEDIDLAWRLLLAGWENHLDPKTAAYHHRSLSGQQSLKQRRQYRGLANKMSYRNHFCLLYKNSFCRNNWKDLGPIFWYEIKKFIYLLIFEPRTLAGLGEFIKLLPTMTRKKRFIHKYSRLKADEVYQWFK